MPVCFEVQLIARHGNMYPTSGLTLNYANRRCLVDALQWRVGLVLVEVRAAVAVQQLPSPVLIVVRVSVLGSETYDGLWVSHWFVA